MSAVVIRPVPIADEALTSNAPESVDEWSGIANYATGNRVRSETTHRIYESTADDNTGNDPADPANVFPADESVWLDIGPSNAWAMFDPLNGAPTVRAESLEVVLALPRIDSLGLRGLVGASLQVTVNDGESDIYDRTMPLVSNAGVTGWWSWFFEERVQRRSVMLLDIPAVPSPIVTIRVTGSDGNVQIGKAAFGRQLHIGDTEFGLNLSARNYSVIEDDEFGGWRVVKRGFSRRINASLFLENKRVDHVDSELLEYRATPLFWGFANRFSAAMALGFYRRLDIEIAYATHSLVTVQIEGTTE